MQNDAFGQETDKTGPLEIRPGDDHHLPFQLNVYPLQSTAIQKEALAQETDVSPYLR